MSRTALPQDILLLICQELCYLRDFATLFQCSLVSRRVASLALEQLYSIHELSPINTAETFNLTKLIRVWRSILLSSIGMTAYPYCTYIRSLPLGNYGTLLEDVWGTKAVRQLEPLDELSQFLVLRGNKTLKRPLRNQAMPLFDFQQSMIASGEAVTRCIKSIADQTETHVRMVHLEASMLPAEILPIWLTRLPSLQSLQLQEGSALTPEAGSAISQWCPQFSEFRCLSCQGSGVDENVANFLRVLRPHTLQCFEVISINNLGEQTLIALTAHAESLKVLTLGNLSGAVVGYLPVLSACTALENINLESQRYNPFDFLGNEVVLKGTTDWIGSCRNLHSLTLTNIRDALLLIQDVLTSPDIHLRYLDLQGFSSNGGEVDVLAWRALGQQDSLEDLTVGGLDGSPEALIVHENVSLVLSICALTNLKSLDLRRTSVRAIELRQIITALPGLANLSFGGDWIDDQILDSLGTLKDLKSLLVNSLSVFTFDRVREFAMNLDPVRQKGVVVEINNQIGKWKFDDSQVAWLSEHFISALGGRIDIGVFHDPDEAHEGDFSSDSD